MPFMLRLTRDGVAIHASHVRKGAATHGCIGVAEPFARRLYRQMQVGDQVAVKWRSSRHDNNKACRNSQAPR